MGGVVKGALKLVGVDLDGNKKAAKEQAKAIRDSANQASRDALLAAQAAQSQIENQQALAAASRKANDLLGKPMEAASVELGVQEGEEDLLGRRGRSRYQAKRGGSSGLNVQKP